MEVLERAITLERQGRSIIHLEIGEPDFDTPRRIVEAGIESLRQGDTHYTDSRGIIELRSAVAEYYNRRYNTAVSEEQVIITMGTSPGLLLVLSNLITEPGDEIILGNPYYPCYPNFIRYLKGIPRFIATREENGYQPKSEDVKALIGPRTRAVIINSPANPTGTLIAEDDIREICELGIPVVSDEIYHGLVYGETEHSALEYNEHAYVLNGFSKLYAMTGWRLGYMIAPAQSMRTLQILQQNFFISPNAFVQHAGVTALTQKHPEIEEMRNRYDARRRYLLEELPKLGLDCVVEPRGAFYFFVNTAHLEEDSYKLAFDVLEHVGVALTPGIDFGDRGEGHLRISYANSLEHIIEGMKRLKTYIEERGGS
ncbi:MAG: pyridoxal phosphate-dependent aminotransferase [bacterium]|nr:MAG: pyridoxal phosphate-dependent aminotransferase [bacterium]